MHAGKRNALITNLDVLSILIGVNDIWHGLNGKYDGTVETYENDYVPYSSEPARHYLMYSW